MPYVYSLVSGLLFGIGYGLLGLKSPAPPLIALAGLLGMLGGDQLISQLKAHLAARGETAVISTPAPPQAAPPRADARSENNDSGAGSSGTKQ